MAISMNQPKLAHKLGIALSLREPPSVPPYGWSYFDHVVAVYLTLNVSDKRAEKVIEKARERPYGLTWGDIFLLENVILSLQPTEILCRNQWIVRERFREIAGQSIYDRYIESGVPKEADSPAKVALLRADLSRLLDFLHWYYALIPIRESKRKSLTIYCILMVTLYSVVLGVALYYFHRSGNSFLAMGVSVIFWGTIGGFVSSQRRMQSIPVDGDPLISVFGLANAGYYLWLSPMLGAIFAVVLTLLFISGTLQGTVFPAFQTQGTTDTFFGAIKEALPTGAVEYAKLFSWSFLAGFAERLVPDSLDRLAMKLSSSTSGTAAPTPVPMPTSTAPGAAETVPAGSIVLGQRVQVPEKTLENALHSGEDKDE